jgi:putative PEP-CTERM system TPR-repeat lipoprotein
MAWRYWFVIAAFVWQGCEDPERAKAEHLERGKTYAEQGNTDAAILEFKNVLQADPRHAAARYQLALAYLSRNDLKSRRDAMHELSLSLDYAPKNLDAQLRIAELYLDFGEHERAKHHAETAVRLSPKDPRALLMRGRSYSSRNSFDDAQKDLEQAQKLAPKQIEPLIYLAYVAMAQQDYERAHERLDKALELDKKSFKAALARGDLFAAQRDRQGAEKAYRSALAVAPEGDESAFIKLSGFFRREGLWKEAEAIYKRYKRAKPKEPQAAIALGSFYAERGQVDLARRELKRALELDPQSSVAQDKLLSLDLDSGNTEALRLALKKLLEQRADHPLAKFYEARLALQEGRDDKAITQLSELVRRHPDIASAQLTLGTALAQSGDYRGAELALDKASKVESTSAKANTALAELHLRQNVPSRAAAAAKKAYQLRPRDLHTVDVYARALARSGDIAGAERVVQRTADEQPDNAAVQHRLGVLARAQQHEKQALAKQERALEIDPNYLPALREIAGIHITSKAFRKAQQRVEQQLKQSPKSAELMSLLGQVFEASGNSRAAENTYLEVSRLSDVASDSYARLAALYIKGGRIDAGTARFNDELSKDPKNLAAHVVLGILSHVSGKRDAARKHYEEALKLNSKAAIAANNLATMLAEENKDLDRALKLAEAAHRQRPEDPNVADTLGWIQHLRKNPEQATSLLKKAFDASPNNPVVMFHYGTALAALDKPPARAKQLLKRLVDHYPKFPQNAAAQATLAEL